MNICLLDPGIEDNIGTPSSNLGDLIIQEAVNREISNIFRENQIFRVSTHSSLNTHILELIKSCSIILLGGTNLLSSNMNKYKQWKISFYDALRLKTVILFGVGWWQYQDRPNLYTRILLRFALSENAIHSVRDEYSKIKLQSLGLKNILNTGCPTMWPFVSIVSQDIPQHKSENVLLMLTDYSKNIDIDRYLIEILLSKYSKVFVWPQGRNDREYISGMNFPVTILDHSLSSLEEFFQSGINFDYIGTRLHGGIKCLLEKRRSLILEIDNRAREIANCTGLPTTERTNFNFINHWIDNPYQTRITINSSAIQQWRNQFLFPSYSSL